MIRLIFEQEAEYIDGISFPEKYMETTIDDDDTLDTLFYELLQMAKVAGYVISKENWKRIGEYIEEQNGFDVLNTESLPFL